MLSIVQTDSGHIYLDQDKHILNLEILNDTYNSTEFKQLCEVFKTYIQEAANNNQKHYVILHATKLGIYPLNCYTVIVDMLVSLESYFKKILNSTCILVEQNSMSNILKFIFNIYDNVRPAKVIHDINEAYDFFSLPENQNTN
jgi:hypothetical protein